MSGTVMYASMMSLAWIVTSAFLNFNVTPTVLQFTEVPGHLAADVYTSFNKLELVFAFLIPVCIHFSKDLKWRNQLRILATIPLFIILYYFFYLVPSLLEMGEALAAKRASETIKGYMSLKNQHVFYHQQYIKIDAIKLFFLSLLTFLLVIGPLKGKEDTSSESYAD